MLASLELEIKYLLSQEESLDEVVKQIVQTVEHEADSMTHNHVETLCRFLLNARAYRALVEFVFKHWNNKDFVIPWPYFLSALSERLNPDLAQLLWKGVEETKSEDYASRTDVIDGYQPQQKQRRHNHRFVSIKKFEDQKVQWLSDLTTLRMQQLYEQEKNLLHRLLKTYPGDQDILKESVDFKERNALDIISRHAPLRRSVIIDDKSDPETEKAKESWSRALTEKAVTSPEISYDLAIAAFMMGLFETALKILSLSSEEDQRGWFKLEALLHARRHLELLQELAQVEIRYSHDPETFFATAYLRAQALWGLGQKHLAIEVMEGLLNARPQYRMGLTLLSEWRGR